MSIQPGVKRGQQSWTYIYIAMGLVISIEGTVIQMTPLTYPSNLIVYFVVTVLTIWLFLTNGWLHNKLIGLKNSYEDTAR